MTAIAIVGAGPLSTYALERLSALIPPSDLPGRVDLTVFDASGRFGAGAVHSDVQAATSYMNRVAGQIALSADETNDGVSVLLPERQRPSFLDFCRRRHRASGHPHFDLAPQEIPRRYVHGLALRDAFRRYVTILRSDSRISVRLIAFEVTCVRPHEPSGFRLGYGTDPRAAIHADHILFVTGHTPILPAPGTLEADLMDARPERLIWNPYPLDERLPATRIRAGDTVGLLGLGLTAIDVLFHLTEGRGGRFETRSDDPQRRRYTYHRGGAAPATLIGFCRSGLPTSCRPNNQKVDDPALEHTGTYFTPSTVRAIRRHHGRAMRLDNGRERHQLDFDRHLFPLVMLEMADVYYRTLLGQGFAAMARRRVAEVVAAFLARACEDRDQGTTTLLAPVDAVFAEAAEYLTFRTAGQNVPGRLRHLSSLGIEEAFLATLYLPGEPGHEASPLPTIAAIHEHPSPWGHPSDIWAHRFDWRRAINPLAETDPDGIDWNQRVQALLGRDLLAAEQGNLRNPTKAACDGVWRDLRASFSEAIDHGGLLAASHERFIAVYLRFYNRLSNGAGIEATRKVLALLDAGALDLSLGPSPAIHSRNEGFLLEGADGTVREVSHLVDCKIHRFDPERAVGPLYRQMLEDGLVRKWRNPGGSAAHDVLPGGLDLNEDFHPYRYDGRIEASLTFLGVPNQGVRFFQGSAARPNGNNYVLNNVAAWAEELVTHIATPPNERSPESPAIVEVAP